MIKEKLIYWIAGTITAFTGVYVVRVISANAAGNKAIIMLAGFTLAILGLFIITLGTRRKK